MIRRIVGLFDSREQAQQAQQDLIRSGLNASDVHLTSQPSGGTAAQKGDDSFWESVRDFFGFNDTSDYREAARRGGTLVTADVPENKVDEAVAVLNRHHPVDINRRVEEWTRGGWQRPAQAAAATRRETTSAQKGETVVPMVEEKLNVGKRREERGGVRVYSHVVEKPVRADVNLRQEHVNVERRPVDRPAGPGAFRERTIEATESHEVPVVNKEARVVEEVAINKSATQHNQAIQDTVRKTNVEVEQLDDDFRKDFDRSYAGKGYTYDQLRPAYQYGRQLGADQRYRDLDWVTVEPEARTAFQKNNPGKWEQFKEAVHHGYEAARTHLPSSRR
jgi:uncharacterized protein (TIGR02271 family)